MRTLASQNLPFLRDGLHVVTTFLALALVAALLAWQPALATGAVLGGLLLWVTVSWPLAVVGVMLALGPLNLSFLTGGFKGLFPQLGGLDMNGIRLVGVSLALAVVVVTEREWLRQLSGPRARWYLAFLLYAGLTLYWSRDPLEGLRLLFKIAYPLLVFLVVAAPGRTRAEVTRLADWVLIGAALVLLFNPFFVIAGGYEVDAGGYLRVGGGGLHENPFSFYLLVVILLCVGRFAERGGLRYLLLIAVAVAWLALTLTRISLAAGVIGLGGTAVYGALVYRSRRLALGAVAVAIVIALALGPGALERTFGYQPGLAELWSMLADPAGLFHSMRWSGREQFWPALMALWVSRPVFGSGMGTSSALMTASFPPEAGGVAHNEYLRLGVDTGLVGVALFFIAAITWLATALRAGRTLRPGVREFALPAVAAIVAWAVISTTDNAFDYYSPFTQFVGFLVGGAVVVARAGEETEASAAVVHRRGS